MIIQKFAAHYMLSPEGRFLKWPVLSVRDDGQILEVQTFPDGLKEQAGVSFFSGFLVPGFIDIWLNGPTASSFDNRFFNRHFSQGTLIMRKPENFDEECRKSFPLLCNCSSIPSGTRLSDGDLPLWERIKTAHISDGAFSLQGLLQKITVGAAGYAGISNAGRLEPDASPGLLVVRGADLTGPSLTPGANVKWLSVPSIARFESLTRKNK